MTVYDPQVTSYSDTTPHVRVISNIIQFIDPRDTPLLDALGGLDAARTKFRVAQNGTKIEILEDEYLPVAGALTVTMTTNATQFTCADASILQDGSVILIDAEYMVVKAVNTTTNICDVYARDYGGTNAAHTTTSVITIVGMARLEGDDADYIGLVDITAPYNYTSIFQAALNISGTQQVIDQYGIGNEYAYQAAKKMPELLRLVERMLFHGVRQIGTAVLPRSAGGLGTFITDNTVAITTSITKVAIDSLMELIMIDGGNPDLLVLHPSVARDVKDLIDTSSFVRFGNEVDQLGTAPVKRISTQYGDLKILMDRWMPSGTAYIIDSSKMGLYTLRPFGWKPLAVTGDSKKGEVVGELSFLVANDKAHGKITGITT